MTGKLDGSEGSPFLAGPAPPVAVAVAVAAAVAVAVAVAVAAASWPLGEHYHLHLVPVVPVLVALFPALDGDLIVQPPLRVPQPIGNPVAEGQATLALEFKHGGKEKVEMEENTLGGRGENCQKNIAKKLEVTGHQPCSLGTGAG